MRHATLAALVGAILVAVAPGIVYGDPVQLTTSPLRDVEPRWDPAGETIVFRRIGAFGNLGAVEADGTGERDLAIGPNSPFGIAAGLFSWVGDSGLITVNETVALHEYMTFDTGTLPQPVIRAVFDGNSNGFARRLIINGGGGGGWFVVSRDGSTALWRYSSNGGAGTTQIRRSAFPPPGGGSGLASSSGTNIVPFNVTTFALQAYVFQAPALTPDGAQFVYGPNPVTQTAGTIGPVFGSVGYFGDLYLYDTTTGSLVRRLTQFRDTGGFTAHPEVSPDGARVLFAGRTGASGPLDLWTVNIDGTGLTQLTTTAAIGESSPTWAPDGMRIAFVKNDGVSGSPDENVYTCDTTVPADCGSDTPPPPADEADLSISKSAPAAEVKAGTTLIYTLTVANAGPDSAENVVVTDVLAPEMAFNAAQSDAGCVEASGTVTCALGDMAALTGLTPALAVDVATDATGALANQASVASDTSDPELSNNTSNLAETTVRRLIGIDAGGDATANVNLCSNGVLPVAIFSSPTFDALNVNAESLLLADAAVRVAGRSGRFLCNADDVDDDGLDDLLCKFDVADITADGVGLVEVELTGETFDDPNTPEDESEIIFGTVTINVTKEDCS